ncbi:hypothetical protein FNV43_RR10169 [Rhamnella rubrinervis]|uniref:Ubiquitin carboxyl-terminal hydrolase n=1 Tax=Rhamnella rubrinervis TaxID=2594499 RepID=A0A8K0HBR3_9ROSA|nr:hypothetical protein FNV43_RR10169 [Rhamnella rubrinervis]
MDSLLTEAQETDNSPLDLVVLQKKNFEGSTLFSPVPEESLDGSLPLSHSDAKDDCVPGFSLIADEELGDGQSSSPKASDLNGSTPPPPLKTLADQYWSPESPHAVEHSVISGTMTVDGDNSETSWVGNEEAQEVEPPPSSPNNLIGHNLSNYSSHCTEGWSSFTPSWSSQWPKWSTSSETRVYSDWLETKPYNVGAGLTNLGNTCFINAVLQCFTHTVPLVQGIRSTDHAMPCERGREGFCVLCALREHIEISLASSGGIVSPLKLVNNLNHFSSYFQRYQQEDAHEFLQCFLDKLERCCLDSKPEKNCDTSRDYNLVERVFGGRLTSKLQCCNCGHRSDTYEPLIDLSLEIEDMDTLTSALESFTKLEKIEDSETKFSCGNCKEEVSVEKQLLVDQAPTVAAFHLKRFKADGAQVDKIDKHVEFPMELDLQSYTSCASQDNVELKYDLYAVVVHDGFSSTSGHYFSIVRSSPDTWYRFDDSKVTRVWEESVLSQEAYILFYARHGTPWFSSLMESQKPCLDRDAMSTSPQSVLDNVENTCNPYSVVTNIDNCEANEFRDNAMGTSSWCWSGAAQHEDNVDANDSRNASGEDTPAIDSSTPLGPRNSFNESTCNNDEKCNTPLLGKSNCHKETNEDHKDKGVFRPLTPPRSKSPETFSFNSPELGYQIPRDHLKVVKRVSCRKPLNKGLQDSKKREAVRYIRKSMPSSRGKILNAFLNSEDPYNKKRRMERANGTRDPLLYGLLQKRRPSLIRNSTSAEDDHMTIDDVQTQSLANSSGSTNHVVIVMDAMKEFSSEALEWALKNVIATGSVITLLGVMPWLNIPLSIKTWLDVWSVELEELSFVREKSEWKNDVKYVRLQTVVDLCRNYGVLLEKKVVMGYPSRPLVVDKIASLHATWVVLDRHQKKNSEFYAQKIKCSMVVVNEEGEIDFIRKLGGRQVLMDNSSGHNSCGWRIACNPFAMQYSSDTPDSYHSHRHQPTILKI